MYFQNFLRFLIIFLWLFTTVSCTKQDNKVLTVGVSPDYPPFAFEYRNELIGFDIDLIKSIAERLKYKIAFKTMYFDELLPALKNKSLDLIASSVSRTDERLKEFDFSHQYYQPSFALVLKKDRLKYIRSLNNVEGVVGVETETTMEQYLRHFSKSDSSDISEKKPDSQEKNLDSQNIGNKINLTPDDLILEDDDEPSDNNNSEEENQDAHKNMIQIKSYRRNTDLLGVLQKDEVEAILLEVLEAEVMVQNDRTLSYIPVLFTRKTDYPYGIVFQKDSKLTTEFNRVLDEIESEGKIDILKLRWFSGYGIYGDILKN